MKHESRTLGLGFFEIATMWASEVGTVVESHDLPDEVLQARKEFRENMAQLEKNRSEVCHLLAIH